MSNTKHLADLLKVCSILPALAIMPAMAVEYTVVSETEIAKIETISGGHSWLDASTASGNQSVWFIKDGDVTVLSEAVFANNRADSGIFSTSSKAPSSLTLNPGVVFENNTVRFDGGAVANYNTLNANGVTFRKNTAQTDFENDTTPMGGGALALGSESKTMIQNSIFSQNESKYHGGAIAMRGPNDGDNSAADLDIIDSEFRGNIAAQNGGAIYSTFYDSENVKDSVYIEDNEFVANTAVNGGAIYNEGLADRSDNVAAMKVIDSEFVGNIVTNYGGAIYNGSKLVLEDSDFSKNDAYVGGAMFLAKGSDTTIKNSKFDSNTADFGGAIYTSTAIKNVDISDSEFTNNSALGAGAAGVFYKGTLNNVLFSGNKATDATDDGAGALFLGALSQVQLNNVDFVNNTSAAMGGAIAMRGVHEGNNKDAKLDIIGGSFTGNTVATEGGAIFSTFYDSENVKDSVYIKGTEFTKNSAEIGGAIYTEGKADLGGGLASMKIEGAKFTENTAIAGGGAIHNLSTLTIENSDFSGNKSISGNGDGGAIYTNTGALTLKHTDFENNFVDANAKDNMGYGGAIYAQGGTIDIQGGEYEDNHALTGGAIYVSKSATSVNIENVEFEGNWASDIGALGIFGKNTTLTNLTFTDNYTTGQYEEFGFNDGGGALFFGAEAQAVLDNGVFLSNESAGVGGAIATRSPNKGDNSAAKLDIKNSTFRENVAATQGGAIYTAFHNSKEAIDNVYLADSVFVANKANEGGAIYNEGLADRGDNFASIYMTGVTFKDNVASVNGGAVFNGAGGTVNLAGINVFSGNVAHGLSNDIHNMGTLNITGGTTSFDGGVTGTGTFTLASDAKLDIGTSAIKQGTINLDGTVMASLLNDSVRGGSYGRFIGDVTVGDNAMFELNVGAAGTYNIWDGKIVDEAQVAVGDIYEIAGIDKDGVKIVTKSVADIADAVGISTQAAGAVAGLANSNVGKAHQISLALQDALNAEDTATVERETKKLNPTDKPVAQAASASVQNQVLALTSGRMAGGVSIGRAGGDERSQENGFWIQGLFNKSKFGDDFHGYTRGVALGADTLIDRKWTIGGGLAFNNSDVHADSMHTDIDSKTLFLYGQYKPNNWFVNATATYNMSEYTDDKTVSGVGVSATYDVDAYGAQIMTGYDFAPGITTEGGLRYLHIAQDGYMDDLNLTTVRALDTDFLTGVAGLKYAFAIENDWAIRLRPELRAAMTYDFISDDEMATVVMPGVASYKVDGERLSRMGGEFGIGLTALYKGVEVSLMYDLDLHRDYTSQTGMIKFRGKF